MKIKIKKCPMCGSKNLIISSYRSQIWVDRKLLKKGKLGRKTKKEYLCGEEYLSLYCQDCDEVICDTGNCPSLKIDDKTNEIEIEEDEM